MLLNNTSTCTSYIVYNDVFRSITHKERILDFPLLQLLQERVKMIRYILFTYLGLFSVLTGSDRIYCKHKIKGKIILAT
jgi:hypothetical protein